LERIYEFFLSIYKYDNELNFQNEKKEKTNDFKKENSQLRFVKMDEKQTDKNFIKDQ
jgi:hypothetical protein